MRRQNLVRMLRSAVGYGESGYSTLSAHEWGYPGITWKARNLRDREGCQGELEGKAGTVTGRGRPSPTLPTVEADDL